jgi:hypothetical protein
MTAPLCKCGCNKPVERRSYETDRQWNKRKELGIFRDKCKKALSATPKAPRPKPTLSPVSVNYGRGGGGESRPKDLPERDHARLAYARSLPCCLCGAVEGVHAHHEAEEGHGTMAGKPSDRRTLPLCWQCHKSRHDHGREVYGRVDAEAVISKINEAYDQRRKA